MKIGTKSILFGVHQFLWHPFTVLLAWRKLYKEWPSWPVCLAILLHDIGYWGLPNMDGEEGKKHPYRGARLTTQIYLLLTERRWEKNPHIECQRGGLLYWFTLTHSRDLAKLHKCYTSKLYAADKCSVLFDPPWFYILRARLSGEMKEFKDRALSSGHQLPGASDREWYDFYRNNVINRPDIKKLI